MNNYPKGGMFKQVSGNILFKGGRIKPQLLTGFLIWM